MAASITNSNETLDSITTGLLIHEVGFLPPSSQRSVLSHALILYSPWFLIYFVPSHFHSRVSLSYFRQKNMVSFGSASSPDHVLLHNSAAYKVQVISGHAGIREKQSRHAESVLHVNGLTQMAQGGTSLSNVSASSCFFPYLLSF